jgi:hypothetical protein
MSYREVITIRIFIKQLHFLKVSYIPPLSLALL